MNEQYASRLFDNYFNLINLAKPVEDSASEIFDAIYALTTSQDDIKDVADLLHNYLVGSDRDFILDIIEGYDEITEEHLKDINRAKREIKHSKAVTDHIKDNIEFFIGIQASDGDMIDFIRSVL